ncbi:molybdopterin-dependent oxidoreductase [Alphaproteobacteria bacterium]|nr:molybdopterin-dependent oxidoreductase [Alphaproteobacteria bacterium]
MADYPSIAKHPDLDQWVSVRTDGGISIRSGKVDIGQRISTALALIAAEELDVDFSRIDIAQAETGLSPDEGITSGSNSMEESGNAVRVATATARQHLLSLAADALGVEANMLEIDDGIVAARGTNRSVSYSDLLGGQTFNIPVDPNITVKAPANYGTIGKPIVARGMKNIVTGKPHFVHDMTFPGMMHARVIHPPHYHARLRSLDKILTGRLRSEGISLVRDGSFLAVAGVDEYEAIKAMERIGNAADWDKGDGLVAQDVFEQLRTNKRESLPVVDGMPRKERIPPLADPPDGAIHTLQATYERPYHMHGSIGPSAAVALFEDGKLIVWTHSQGIYVLRASMAEALGLEIEALRIIHVPGAGCYGHNGADDVALDAALVARALPDTPILLKWTRADEHAWEPYGSSMVLALQGSVDAAGAVVAWSHETYSDTYGMRPRAGDGGAGPARLLATRFLAEPLEPYYPNPTMGRHAGIHRNLDPLYNFPNKRLVKNLVRDLPLRTSALRTLGAYANVFAIESFMDELAEAAQMDALTFRLNHLGDQRAKDVLQAAADRVDWGKSDLASGHGQGIAVAQYKNMQCYAAVAVELEVTDAAEVRLHRVTLAADAGQVVDAAGLTAQMEGGFLQAASWTLYEQVTFDRDGITSRDWDSYPILRFDNIPAIETILLNRPGEPYRGAGEAAAGPTAGAIANAIYGATGLRLRRIPFTSEAIRTAALG